MTRKKFISAAVITGIFFIIILLAALKKGSINGFFASRYKAHGVDVSHYQGEIDWEKLEEAGIDFAFIKATEGSGHVDERFAENWKNAGETGIKIGAYHFFSFDSEGEKQAEWYIENVGILDGRLAPVADVEYYGNKEAEPPEKEEVVLQLRGFLEGLEEFYGVKPIIYTTYKVYRRYIEGEFQEYPLWIRNVYYPPHLDIGEEWKFWQYTDKGFLEGYEGEEKYIDMNIFRGTEEDLEAYMVPEKKGS